MADQNLEATGRIPIQTEEPITQEDEVRRILAQVVDIIRRNGRDPVRAITDYLLSEDPAHIPPHEGARALMAKLDRDAVLRELVVHYLH